MEYLKDEDGVLYKETDSYIIAVCFNISWSDSAGDEKGFTTLSRFNIDDKWMSTKGDLKKSSESKFLTAYNKAISTLVKL